jgi:hypothetical protein
MVGVTRLTLWDYGPFQHIRTLSPHNGMIDSQR